ncbi:CDP-glucose 4,6-dehydratase [Filimonas zeae]|uniref:CDP-glucose 4,6-dehydratase n=1 Tax=Filimonas zeae TaxID=1737353 RepID=A0A917IV78_9BACT|nr:CDP-glucose 4,6-dehydratase [Filimonas zeae]MDR6339007.1 CDP-glucose 4,6-dehydratase [Filimonas zeae]GGH65549.1 CDP-glucose 4,6-dehydratase [Filimonas zeae]
MSFNRCFENKKVLITGHTGFKGSWLAIWLQQLGAQVYGYALDPLTPDDNFVRCNLAGYIHHTTGDVTDRRALQQVFDTVQPDIAFHLAAQPLVLLSYNDPVNTFSTNIMGVVHFLEAVKRTPSVKAAVNITSDKCYANNEWTWGYRENDPMGGRDPYSASKGCAELVTASYLHSFFQHNACVVASARAGNVIGGGDWAADRIVPDFFRAVKANKSMVLRNPYATRPWQHVLEPLSGYLHLAWRLLEEGQALEGGWNFGPEDNANYSVRYLIEALVAAGAKGSFEIAGEAVKPHEATFLKLDISKAVNYLQWRPALSFLDTVRFTVQGYQAEITGSSNLLAERIKQIHEYTALARLKNIKWAQ